MRPGGDCVWMIGDNSTNDIKGAKEKINAVTLQKLHDGLKVSDDPKEKPDACFYEYKELSWFLKTIYEKNDPISN